MTPTPPLLDVKDLQVSFPTPQGFLPAVRGVSFSIQPGEILGLVGESGCGKSQILFSLMRLLPSHAHYSGQAYFQGQDLFRLTEASMRNLRGSRIALIFQDPMSALNPYMTLEQQMTEVSTVHQGLSFQEAQKKAQGLLERVYIPDAKTRLKSYPHELSGGMRQRVIVAMALMCDPVLILADEPTTALDVTVQYQVLQMLKELQAERDLSILFVTHDLGVVSALCDRVHVMYAGDFVEKGHVHHVIQRSQHPYTQALLSSIPSMNQPTERLNVLSGHLPQWTEKACVGCLFEPRCPKATDQCRQEKPRLKKMDLGEVSCHHVS